MVLRLSNILFHLKLTGKKDIFLYIMENSRRKIGKYKPLRSEVATC